jgi:ribose-phosphate pyrophosphokinase
MAGLYDQLTIFGGNSNTDLTREICDYIDVPQGRTEILKFSNENIFVRIGESVRENDVFVVQSLGAPVSDSIMEMLIMIDTLRRSSAGRITAVIPYYAYGRTDKKDQPRVPITARLLADMITVAGADRVLTLDLHAGQIQGFFNIPVDEMSAFPILSSYFIEKRLPNPVVVSPDLGNTKRARNFAEALNASLAVIEKRRTGNDDKSEVLNLIGSVDGHPAILVDDEIDTAGSITQAAKVCIDNGATEVYACASHGVLSGPAIERLQAAPLREIVITNTLAVPPEKRIDKLTVLSVGMLIGETIQRIHTGASVSLTYRAVDRVLSGR